MKNSIIEKIESLPPLPKSVIELEEFRKKPNKEAEELLKIIEKDPLIVTTLLKVANSAMFGFRHSVESPSRAISLLGVNFTISIALGSIIQNSIKSNLESYGVTSDDFMFISNLASSLVSNWVVNISMELRDELLLPAFLQETGKFIISDIIKDKNLVEEFQDEVREGENLSKLEEKYAGFTCAKITANIFKHWKLSSNLIFAIGFVGDIENSPEGFEQKVQILEIVKILTTISAPLSDENIAKAIAKAKEYNLNIEILEKAIEKTKTKLSEEN